MMSGEVRNGYMLLRQSEHCYARWWLGMTTRRNTLLMLLLCLFTLTVPVVFCADGMQIPIPDEPLNRGPYVDAVTFAVISNDNQRVLALQAGEIEMDTGYFDPVHYDTLNMDPDISINSVLRNGYGHLTINCRDNPLNYSVLRKAFAFAYDKTKACTDLLDGFAQEHDSLVPYVSSWCVEETFSYHYYTNQSDIGNSLLDAAGFAIDGGTGFRKTPFGDPFQITIEYPSSSPSLGGGVAQIAVDAFTSLHIDSQAVAADFMDYMFRLDNHGDYDIIFYAMQFYDNDVDWLAYEYWSEYADVLYQNPCNFVNATYDLWREQLLNGTTYEDVYEASAAMQTILHENVPRLVVYENTYLQAYRNDAFAGQVPDANWGIAGQWTMRKIHQIGSTPGGTVPVAIAQEPDSFNIFVTSSSYSAYILQNLYPSLYKYSPSGTPQPDLAQSMLVQTHSDNAAVPEGHTRYTIDIISNATWSDGTPLSADDVAFTFTYNKESGAYGNPAGVPLSMLVAAYAPSATQVVLEFGSESYWHFSSFAYTFIIPQHIFTTIGYSGWNTWNPVYDSEDPHVTCGPFRLTSFEAGDWYEITRNPTYHWLPPEAPSNPPVIVPAGNVTYTLGATGNFIAWDVSDDDPLGYILYMDGLLIAADIWSTSTLSFNVDGLGLGLYNFTLQLFDISSNVVASTIWVEVLSATSTSGTSTTGSSTNSGQGLPPTILLLGVGAGVAVILVVVVVFIKQRPT
jgi:ABC-type transport system substrate-binding protein